MALCALLVATQLESAPVAQAVPIPSSYFALVVEPEIPIAQNGALLITSSSPGDSAPFVAVRAESASAPIEGTLVRVSSAYWSWLPAEPLPPGSYLVSTQAFAEAPLTEQEVTFSDELAPESPEILVTATTEFVDYPDAFNCCSYDDKAVGDGQCFPTTTWHTLHIHYQLTSTLSNVALHQFLFRTRIPGADVSDYAATAAGFNAYSTEAYYEQAPEYCAVIEAIDLATQTVHSFPELSPLCVPHGTLGIVGYDPFEYDAADLDRHNCDLPPDSLVEPWCEYNHDACEPLDFDDLIANDCRFYDATCNGGEVPDVFISEPDAGMIDDDPTDDPPVDMPDAAVNPTSGAGGEAGGSEGASGIGGSAPLASDVPTPSSKKSSGCSTTTPRDASPRLTLIMLLTLFAGRRLALRCSRADVDDRGGRCDRRTAMARSRRRRRV